VTAMTNTVAADALGQPLDTRTASRSATADEVRFAAAELFNNYARAAEVMPVSWIAAPICDLMMATAYGNAGRRGDAMRRAMVDLNAALDEAHRRLQGAADDA
jgi:hypothetical protein